MATVPKVGIDDLPTQFVTDNSSFLEDVASQEIITPESQNVEGGLFLTLQERLSSAFINAREHGAKGDGSSDDTTSLNDMAAVGAAVFYMPPGTYLVTSDITFTAGSVILAAGVAMSGGNLVGAKLVLSGTNGNVIVEDGSRDFTGTVVGVTPTFSTHLATRGYVDAPPYIDLSAPEATPDVDGLTRIILGGIVTITNFLNGADGQVLVCWSKSGARTVQHNANINLSGSVDFAMGMDDTLMLSFDGSKWNELARKT